jgi:hypothetical protein
VATSDAKDFLRTLSARVATVPVINGLLARINADARRAPGLGKLPEAMVIEHLPEIEAETLVKTARVPDATFVALEAAPAQVTRLIALLVHIDPAANPYSYVLLLNLATKKLDVVCHCSKEEAEMGNLMVGPNESQRLCGYACTSAASIRFNTSLSFKSYNHFQTANSTPLSLKTLSLPPSPMTLASPACAAASSSRAAYSQRSCSRLGQVQTWWPPLHSAVIALRSPASLA